MKRDPKVLTLPLGPLVRALKEETGAEGLENVPGLGHTPVLVHEPAESLVTLFLHPSFSIVEYLFRVLPEQAWYNPTVGPRNTVQFDLGTFKVPRSSSLWLYDYEFSAYRFSGIDPGDYIKAEAGRFGGVMGFDLTIGLRRPSQLHYELDPVPVQFSRRYFEPQLKPGPDRRATPAQFNRQAAQSFAAASGQGLALLPAWRKTQGPEGGPFTMVVDEGDSVNLGCVIWRRITSPLAAIEGRFAGFLMNNQLSKALVERTRPR